MSLSNIDKKHVENLFESIEKKQIDNKNIIQKVQNNHVQYAKLKLIAEQMNDLKKKAQEIIDEALYNEKLHDVKCNFEKKSGQTYHLYKNKKDELLFSIIGPQEWFSCPYTFVNSYFYDFDKNFIQV